MNCPSCHALCQSSDQQCPACGLIFSKWEARHKSAAPSPDAAAAPRSRVWALLKRGLTAFVLLACLWEAFAFTLAVGWGRGFGQAAGGVVVVFILAWLLERQLQGLRRIWRGEEAPTGPGSLAGGVAGLLAAAFVGFVIMCLPYFMRPFTAQRAMHRAIEAKVPEAARLEVLDREGRRRAAEALAGFLQDADPLVRQGAAYQLGRLAGQPGVAAADIVPRLAAALQDPDNKVLRQAASSLGAWGSAAADVIPALLAASEREKTIPSAAAGALSRMELAGKAALIGALADPGSWTAQAAAYELGSMGPSAADAVPALEAALARAPSENRISFSLALDKIRK